MIYIMIFLILLFICFMVLLKALDVLYLKTFLRTIAGLFVMFFTFIFPFIGTYYLTCIFSPKIAVDVFETGILGQFLSHFLQHYFVPLYFLFAVISIVIMITIELGRIKKQTTTPIKIQDGPDVRDRNIRVKNKNLTLRTLKSEDKEYLLKWLNTEEVLEYYNGRDTKYDLNSIYRHYYNDDNICRLIMMLEDEPIGYMQYYPITKAELSKYNFGIETLVFGIDLFIGVPDYFGKGYGTRFVTMLRDYLVNEEDAAIVVVDPMVENERAIRCYEKCGFKKYQLLPRHQRHEGVLQDCYLMEYRPNKTKDEVILKQVQEDIPVLMPSKEIEQPKAMEEKTMEKKKKAKTGTKQTKKSENKEVPVQKKQTEKKKTPKKAPSKTIGKKKTATKGTASKKKSSTQKKSSKTSK